MQWPPRVRRNDPAGPARTVVFGCGSSPLEDGVPVPPEVWDGG